MIGRPPSTISEEKLHELGMDLLKWVATEGKGNIQFVRWYHSKHQLHKLDWKNLKKRESFRPYYDLAVQFMIENIVLNKDIAQSYGNRYLCYYDEDLLEYEEAVKDRDAKRKASENKTLPPNDSAVSTLLTLINENKSLNERLEALANATKSKASSVDPASDQTV